MALRNIINLRYADDTTFMAKSEEQLKSLLMKVKEESEKVGLKLNIDAANLTLSHPAVFFLSLNFLFISLCLCWVFVLALGLSLVVVSGATLPCSAWASHCCGFSC